MRKTINQLIRENPSMADAIREAGKVCRHAGFDDACDRLYSETLVLVCARNLGGNGDSRGIKGATPGVNYR